MGATTAHRSTTELLTLHAVRLKGMADDGEVAARFALDRSESDELLLDFEAYGWVTRVDFAGTGGWTLTAAGRREDERRLADELAAVGAAEPVHDAYRSFLPFNGRLLKACTEWQLRPTPDDALGPNDHSDIVLGPARARRAGRPGRRARRRRRGLSGRLDRFAGYDQRYGAALTRAVNGEHAWVTRPRVDSCHTVWMELHEDLLATLGIDRGDETDDVAELDRRR